MLRGILKEFCKQYLTKQPTGPLLWMRAFGVFYSHPTGPRLKSFEKLKGTKYL